MTLKQATQASLRDMQEAEAFAASERERFRRHMQHAQNSGATVRELMEWTGYSRRQVFYLLANDEKGTR